MTWRAGALAVALLVAGCSSLPPVPIAAGDVCFHCRRVINDTQMAAEMIDTHGLAFKFNSVGCMAKFLKANPDNIGAIYVTDYTNRRLIKASGAIFVPTVIVEGYQKTPDYIAFGSSEDARATAEREKAEPIRWQAVLDAAD